MVAAPETAVFISYSNKDRVWRDRIFSILINMGLTILDDTNLRPSQDWDIELTKMRERADAAILIVTPNFLASQTITRYELPHLLALRNSRGLPIFPVIAETSSWQDFKPIRNIQVFPEGGRPLFKGSEDQISTDLARLAREIIDVTSLEMIDADKKAEPQGRAPSPSATSPVPSSWATEESTKKSQTEPAISPLSDRVRAILVRADQIRIGRNLKWVHTGDLLQSLAEEGSLLYRLLLETSVDLKLLVGVIPFHDSEPSIEIDKDLPRISPNVRRALVIARGQADDEKSKTIEEQHLVFGVLSITGNQRVKSLNDRGITPERIKQFAKGIQVEKNPLEFEKPTETPSLITTPGFALAGYKSDDPTGKDLLDTQKEANALASVLAAKDVDPPLSLGLFGDWGSGKSFFMGQMQARITELQKVAREAKGQSAYCQDIVQLTFNAWNYIDSDLWASMASEIFEGLAGAVAEKRGKDSKEERALVLAATSSSQTVLVEAEQKKDRAEKELKQTENRLQELQQSQADVEASLSPRELFHQASRFALAQEEVRQNLDEAAKQLHLPEAKAAAGKLKDEILELHGIGKTLLFVLRNTRNLWMWVLAAVAAAGLAWLSRWLITQYKLGDLVNRAVTALGAISGFLVPFLLWANKASNFIQKARESKQRLIEENKRAKTAELVAQQVELTKKVADARQAVTDATRNLETLNQRLEQMRADRQMADFIRQRHESSDYTQRLGTIARVRADFKHLSSLLRDVQNESRQDSDAHQQQDQKEKQRQEETKRIAELRRQYPAIINTELRTKLMDLRLEELKKERPGMAESALREMVEDEWKQLLFTRIDRIILYIDDLDRCPEKNVVDVLQAVHLLLAFPLFVVVVGVDPRWLLHALRQHSTAFQTKKENDAASDETGEELLWQSTPMNYLEKIFQIPFTLRPIRKKGFEELVDAFAKPMEKKATIRQSAGTQTSTVVQKPKIKAEPGVPVDPTQSGLAANLPGSPVPTTPAAVAPGVPQAPPSPSVTPASQPLPAVAAANPKEAIDRNPEHLHISDGERDFMKKLHPLIPSPRAGKRFINIYRLLRASVEDKDRVAFVGDEKGGEYRAALVLLGILTGYPEEATEILKALIEQQPSTTWRDFLNQFWIAARAVSDSSAKASQRKSQNNRDQVGKIRQTKAERWLELLGKLDDIDRDADINSLPCLAFNRWAEQVARYSFQSGRVLLYQKEP
jgi:hypothetical protein